MPERTPEEVGDLVRQRRIEKGLTQEDVPGVSSATFHKIEAGKQTSFRASTLRSLGTALDWPIDALDRLTAGEDPAGLEEPVSVSSADGVDFDEVRRLDPEGYAQLEATARLLRDRARARLR